MGPQLKNCCWHTFIWGENECVCATTVDHSSSKCWSGPPIVLPLALLYPKIRSSKPVFAFENNIFSTYSTCTSLFWSRTTNLKQLLWIHLDCVVSFCASFMRCGGGIGVVWGLFRHGMATREFRSHQPPSKTGIKLQLKPVLTICRYLGLCRLWRWRWQFGSSRSAEGCAEDSSHNWGLCCDSGRWIHRYMGCCKLWW